MNDYNKLTDPNEAEYIEIHFEKEMVYDHRRSTLQAICIRQRGNPKDTVTFIPVSMLKYTGGKPILPPTYFRSIWVNVKLAYNRGWMEPKGTN